MTLISTLVNKFLNLIGASNIASVEVSSVTLFEMFAIALIICGVLTIIKKRPVIVKFKEYTPESVAKASTLLGVNYIVLGILTVIIGVLNMDQIPVLAICIAAGIGLIALMAIAVKLSTKLVKNCAV